MSLAGVNAGWVGSSGCWHSFQRPSFFVLCPVSKDPLTFLEGYSMIYSEYHRLSSPGSKLCNRVLPAQIFLGSEPTPVGRGEGAGWMEGKVEL